MWLVNNRTPYAADSNWIQDKDANKIWLVVVKATFDIAPDGTTQLAEQQELPLIMGQPRKEFGTSSLIYDADLLSLKPGTDVIVNGSAWAPSGKSASSLDAQITVGPIAKRVRVFGDRYWRRGLAGPSISAPQPFESVPIVFERAFGGWDRSSRDPADHRLESRNPVGTGFSVRSENCIDKPLPNVESPEKLIRSWGDHPPPAGVGVVDCAWSPRRELAGTYDEAWKKNRFPLWAQNYDRRYAHAAPVDQQVPGFLRGGELMTLVNLSRYGTLSFKLPRVYPFFQTYFRRDEVEHRGQLCTVIVEPDVPRVVMAWQSSLICNRNADDLDETVVTQKRMINAQ